MQMLKIHDDLLQFNSHVEPINLSFNQYLLLGEEPLLVHTGTVMQAQAMLPLLREVLGGKELSWIFISHFESDECGGLALLLKHYPAARPICSAVTARQLGGFAITDRAEIKAPGEVLHGPDHQFQFIAYPSEMHLWEGLLLFESNRKILFSSDLFGHFGKTEERPLISGWNTQVQSLTPERLPLPPAALEKFRQSLQNLPVSFIAPGHGTCIEL